MKFRTRAQGYIDRKEIDLNFKIYAKIKPEIRPDEEADMKKDDYLYQCGFCDDFVSPDLLGIRIRNSHGYYGNICEECCVKLRSFINLPPEERVEEAK